MFYIAIADGMFFYARKQLVAVMGGNKKDGKVNLIITTARKLTTSASLLILAAVVTVLMRVLKRRGAAAAAIEILIYLFGIQINIVFLMNILCAYVLKSTMRKRGFTPPAGMTTQVSATTTGGSTTA